MPGAGDLEERPVLLAERDLAVVEEARDVREAKIVDGLAEVDLALALEHAQRVSPSCTDRAVYARSLAEDTAYPR